MQSSPWLEKKYLDFLGAQLPLFQWVKPTLARCRCVLCGDSQKNPRKRRGYFHERAGRWYFKCQNCGIASAFTRFLKQQDPALYEQYLFELLKEQGYSSKNRYPAKNPAIIAGCVAPPAVDILDPTWSLASVPSTHPGAEYLASRKIPTAHWLRLFYTESWKSFIDALGWESEGFKDDGPRLLIPFWDQHKQLVACQSRALFRASSATRYLTAKSHPDIPKIYGLDLWTPAQPTWVCEGPLDSLFVPNCLASAGADLLSLCQQLKLPPDTTTLVFDHERRNAAIVRQVERAIALGYPCVIWPDHIHGKDINDLAREYPDTYLQLLTNWTVQGLRASVELTRWRRDDGRRATFGR